MKRRTIQTIVALTLCVGIVSTYGSLQSNQQIAQHGPLGPPDGGGGSIVAQHGPLGPPDGGGGSIIAQHGPLGPPDGGGGSLAAV